MWEFYKAQTLEVNFEKMSNKNLDLHIKSPLVHSHELSLQTNRNFYLKLDNCQPSDSFKIRGIGHMILKVTTFMSLHFSLNFFFPLLHYARKTIKKNSCIT